MAGNLHLLIQFMSSQEPCFLLATFWILRSKNNCFVFLTVLQKVFQSSRLFKDLYFSRSLLQFSSHQLLECFVILITFEFFSQALSTVLANSLTALSRLNISDRLDILRFLIDVMTSLIKDTSSLLSLMIECLIEMMLSSTMRIVMVTGHDII